MTETEVKTVKPVVSLPRGPKLDYFDGSISSKVLKFIEKYESLAKFYSWSDEEKLQRICLYLEDSALSWFKQEIEPKASDPKFTWSTFLELFKETFLPSSYKDFLAEQLNNRKQAAGEPVIRFIIDVKELCLKINPSMEEAEILRHLFRGVRPELKSALYAAEIKSVDKFREFAKNLEKGMVNTAQSDEISELKSLIQELLSNNASKVQIHRPRYTNAIQSRPERTICYYCNKPGHYKSNCRLLLSKYNQPPYANNYQSNRQSAHQSNRQTGHPNQFYNHNNPNFNQFRTPLPLDQHSHSTYEDWVQYYPSNYLRNVSPDTNSTRTISTFTQGPYPNLSIESYAVQPIALPAPQNTSDPTVNTLSETSKDNENYVFTTAWVDQKQLKCIIDSGSAVSIIRISSVPKPNNVRHYEGPNVTSASGHHISILGRIRCLIQVTGILTAVWTNLLVVADDFTYPLLLGNNFNKAAGVILNLRTMRVQAQTASTEELDKFNHFDFINNSNCNKYSLNLGYQFETTYGFIPLDLNFVKTPSNLKCLGLTIETEANVVLPYDQFSSFQISIDKSFSQNNSLPEGEAITRSDEYKNEICVTKEMNEKANLYVFRLDHLDYSQQNQVKQLLSESLPASTFGNENLGQCTLYPSIIDTVEHPPRKSNPYPKLEAERKEINRQIEEMIVRPSFVPWDSPIVLVSKPIGNKHMCVDLSKVDEPRHFGLNLNNLVILLLFMMTMFIETILSFSPPHVFA